MTQMAEMWRYRGLIGNFASRELKSKYKHSVLGWTWSLHQPGRHPAGLHAGLLDDLPCARRRKRTTACTTYVHLPVHRAGGLELLQQRRQRQHGRAHRRGTAAEEDLLPAVRAGDRQRVLGAGADVDRVGCACSSCCSASATSSWSDRSDAGHPLLLLLVFASGIGLLFALFNVCYRDVSYSSTIVLQLLFYATPVIWAPSLSCWSASTAHFAIAGPLEATRCTSTSRRSATRCGPARAEPELDGCGWCVVGDRQHRGRAVRLQRGARDVGEEL